MLHTSQRSCARSIPRARRRRTTIDTTPAAVSSRVRGAPADTTAHSGQLGNTARGLETFTPDEEPGMLTDIVGVKMARTASSTARTKARRASWPQRPVGSRPLGNTRVITNNSTTSGPPDEDCTMASAITSGATAPASSWAAVAGTVAEETAKAQAPARRSQPTECRGRRMVRKPPTMPYGALSSKPTPLVRPTARATATTTTTAIRPPSPNGRLAGSAAPTPTGARRVAGWLGTLIRSSILAKLNLHAARRLPRFVARHRLPGAE